MYIYMRPLMLDTSADYVFPFIAGVQTAESWHTLLAFGGSVEVLGKQTTFSHCFNVTHKILR